MPRTKDAMALDDQLCFALYATSRAMTARYRQHLDAIGLTYPQYLVMVALWDEETATVSQLGDRLRLDSGTLSPLLKRLEANGLIIRSRRPEDERSVEVRASAKGRRLRGRAARIPDEIRASLSAFDHEHLMSELRALEAVLREAL